MVNLHINDTFLPLMISPLNAGNIMCRELIRMTFVGLHVHVYDTESHCVPLID